MGRKTTENKNTLTIEPTADGRYRLFGYINGAQVRRQHKDIAALDALKFDLERKAIEASAALGAVHPLPDSWISIPQLREAEAAFQLIGGRSINLLHCVQIGIAQLGDGTPTLVTDAERDYLLHMKERGCGERHLVSSKWRLRKFLKYTKAENLSEIDARTVERYLLRATATAPTRVHDAATVRSFFNFAVERRLLRVSPFTVNVSELKKRAAKGRARPRLLTASQCSDLLDAAIAQDGGNHVPYLLLCLWGGIRRAEVERLTVEDIRFHGKGATVSIRPQVSKTATYRDVVLPENIVPLLQECIKGGWLTKDPIGEPLRHGWLSIRKNAGLLDVWQGNILRHTGLSYYFKKTGNIVEVARQAGHSTDVSFRHYISLGDEADAEKFYSIRATLTPAPEVAKVA